MLVLKANAKINLFLDILARLENGYHSLFMLMQSVSLGDIVTLEKQNEIECICNSPQIPDGEKNIAFKAAKAFFASQNIKGGVKISIEKHIPSAAGIAGGSADAAAVLKGLNILYGTDLSDSELCRIGAKVGADVPFCIVGSTMLVQNIGDVLSPLPEMPDWHIVLVKPEIDVSTAQAYADFDSSENVNHLDCVNFLYHAASGDYDTACRYAGNVFEQFIEVPDRVYIKSVMRKHNAKFAQMSGSGPTVFGLFEKEEDAAACADELKEKMKNVFLCKPAKQGVEIV